MKPFESSVPAMSEADLQRGVLDLARVLGWRVVTFRAARTAHGWRTPTGGDGNGWPDLFMVRGSRILAAELKGDRGRLTDEQLAWLAALSDAEVETHIWRPVDYPDRVAEALR